MITAIVERVGRRAIADRAEKRPLQHWGEFVLAEGFLDAWEVSSDDAYLAATREIVDGYVERGPDHGAVIWQWGGIGLPALRLARLTGSQTYREFGLANVERLRKRTRRTKDGGIATGRLAPREGGGVEFQPDRPQLWIDVLHFACPAFVEAAALTGDGSLCDEAVQQFRVYLAHLLDEATGLTYHVWDEETDSRYPCLWARGNGWAALAAVETLARLPAEHAGRPFLLGFLARQVEAICGLQDASGHWHTVIDRPDSNLETSAAAIFGLALVRGVRFGLLDRRWLEAAARGWTALLDRVGGDDRVSGVSAGTPPGDFEHYNQIATGVEPYGTGLFLQLGVEMSRLAVSPSIS